MNYKSIFLTFTLAFILFGCHQKGDVNIIGKWQSLNRNTVIEFSSDSFDLYTNGKPLWSQASTEGVLHYTLSELGRDWYSLDVFDGDKVFVKCKLEVVSKDRIRVYYFKHHNILDLADEYYRTNDFNSLNSILNEIMEKPDTVYFK
jgi:hypothetical protein